MNNKKSEVILILGGVRSGKSGLALTIAEKMAGPEQRIAFIATGSAGDDEMKERIENHKRERPPSWITIETPVRCADKLLKLFFYRDNTEELSQNTSGQENSDELSQLFPGQDSTKKTPLHSSKQDLAKEYPELSFGLDCTQELTKTFPDMKKMKELAHTPSGTPVVILDCLTMLAANVLMEEGENTKEDILSKKIIHELDALFDLCREKGAALIVVSNEVGMGVVPDSKMGRVYRDILGKGNKHAAARADKVLLMIAGLAVDLKQFSFGCVDYEE